MHCKLALYCWLGLRTVVGGTSLLALVVLYSRFGGPTHICSADIVGNTRICLSDIRVNPPPIGNLDSLFTFEDCDVGKRACLRV